MREKLTKKREQKYTNEKVMSYEKQTEASDNYRNVIKETKRKEC